MRNSSIWPLKGLAMPLTCRPMPKAAELTSMGSVSLICAGEGTRRGRPRFHQATTVAKTRGHIRCHPART
jgi:hypothetical protein